MQIHKHPNETHQEFIARAFRWNRVCGEAFAARQARYAALCNCNQGRLACRCQVNESYSATPLPAGAPVLIQGLTGATPFTVQDLRTMGTPLAFGPTVAMSRRRAIWYGAGLVFGVALIAVAVLGFAG